MHRLGGVTSRVARRETRRVLQEAAPRTNSRQQSGSSKTFSLQVVQDSLAWFTVGEALEKDLSTCPTATYIATEV